MSATIIYTPYTYLIGWSKLTVYYYGVRYSKNCHPSDLFVRYFTSSRRVHALLKEHGRPDIVQVRRTFSDSEAARKWEHTVLRRLNARKSEIFLNMTDAIGFPVMKGKLNPMFGRSRPDSSRRMSEKNPMRQPDVVRKAMLTRKSRGFSAWNKGIPNEKQRLKFTNNNPMKDYGTKRKMVHTRFQNNNGKDPTRNTKWIANIHSKQRKRIKQEDLHLYQKSEGWITLGNKKPIPDFI